MQYVGVEKGEKTSNPPVLRGTTMLDFCAGAENEPKSAVRELQNGQNGPNGASRERFRRSRPTEGAVAEHIKPEKALKRLSSA